MTSLGPLANKLTSELGLLDNLLTIWCGQEHHGTLALPLPGSETLTVGHATFICDAVLEELRPSAGYAASRGLAGSAPGGLEESLAGLLLSLAAAKAAVAAGAQLAAYALAAAEGARGAARRSLRRMQAVAVLAALHHSELQILQYLPLCCGAAAAGAAASEADARAAVGAAAIQLALHCAEAHGSAAEPEMLPVVVELGRLACEGGAVDAAAVERRVAEALRALGVALDGPAGAGQRAVQQQHQQLPPAEALFGGDWSLGPPPAEAAAEQQPAAGPLFGTDWLRMQQAAFGPAAAVLEEGEQQQEQQLWGSLGFLHEEEGAAPAGLPSAAPAAGPLPAPGSAALDGRAAPSAAAPASDEQVGGRDGTWDHEHGSGRELLALLVSYPCEHVGDCVAGFCKAVD